jgi:CTP synthase (UTP-ammonia lyase)
MGQTSNEAKQRWNSCHYAQLKVALPIELIASFKTKCMADGVSMASEISRFINVKIGDDTIAIHPASTATPYDTRKKRRRAVQKIISQLNVISVAEQRSMQNIPENLQNSNIYETSEETVNILDEVLDKLSEAY